MKNVGKADKILRYVLALVLFSTALFLEGNLRFIALIGFIPLLTACLGTCPLYMLCGKNTCGTKK